MLPGFEVSITQEGHHTFLISGKDAEKLHAKLKSAPATCKYYTIGKLENGAFPMEKIAASVANSNVAAY